MLTAQSTSSSVWFVEQSSTEVRSKEEGIFGKLAGLSMLEEAEVAMQVQAATKISDYLFDNLIWKPEEK